MSRPPKPDWLARILGTYGVLSLVTGALAVLAAASEGKPLRLMLALGALLALGVLVCYRRARAKIREERAGCERAKTGPVRTFKGVVLEENSGIVLREPTPPKSPDGPTGLKR